MKWFGKVPIGKDGRPVEFIKGHPVLNFIRMLLHIDRKKTATSINWIVLGEANLAFGGFDMGSCRVYSKPCTSEQPHE